MKKRIVAVVMAFGVVFGGTAVSVATAPVTSVAQARVPSIQEMREEAAQARWVQKHKRMVTVKKTCPWYKPWC